MTYVRGLRSPSAVLCVSTVAASPCWVAAQVSVSTVGLVPQLRALVAASKCQLAVSLHATTDEVRNWLVPVNRRRARHQPCPGPCGGRASCRCKQVRY